MTESTMPYFWRMYQLENHNRNNGYHFFSPDTMRFFSSRIQTLPPYKGRVFVTSEVGSFQPNRRYTVRCIRPDGQIDTIGPDPDRGGFQYFGTRQSAHRFAESYAAKNFARVGNESVKLPKETTIV
jgi:hypothetical protein